MDTTRIEITGNEIHHLTETLSNSSKGLDSGTVGLIAAVIGASAAILSQLIIFSLDKRKEKNKLKMELVADERRLSLILAAYYKEFIACSVSKAYWYQCSLLKYFTALSRQ